MPEAEFVDVRGAGVPEAVLAQALEAFAERLVNTRSTTWRGLDEQTRAMAPLALLRAHPALMKRPLIVDAEAMHLGWDKATQAALGV